MLESPAYRALSLSGRRVLDCIEIEFAQHAGKNNGKLPVTFRDFRRYGMHSDAIAQGIRETVILGFVEVTRAGRAGNAAFRISILFRLTYRHTDREEPTHEWRRITTMQEAKLLRQARSQEQKTAPGNRTTTAPETGPQVRSGNRSTVHGPETGALSISRGGDLPGGRLSAETVAKVWTTQVGRGRGAVEVIRDDERCYGFLRRSGSGYQAWWSGEKFDDHLIGEFESEAAAIAAVVEAAGRSDQPAASGRR